MSNCFKLPQAALNTFIFQVKGSLLRTVTAFSMEIYGLNILAWVALGMLAAFLAFRQFKKRIFAAFCSHMSKGPMFRKEKHQLFSKLNEQAKKAAPRKLKVVIILGP